MILGNKHSRSASEDIDIPVDLDIARNVKEAEPVRPIAPSKVESPSAVIGSKIRFKGELVGEEDLLIQGQVDGTIDLKGNNLIIGKHGVVKANVLAKSITVEGKIEGDVFGEERISVLSSSDVRGNLIAERVTLEDGAKFKGSIDMDMDARKADLKAFPRRNERDGTNLKEKTHIADTAITENTTTAS